MNGTRSWCTLVDVHPEAQTSAGRKTYAMVSGRSTGHSLASELVESNDGHEEIIKVYLKGRSGDKMIHEKNINQLKSEVQYIQEARNSLQKLREDISSKLDKDPGASLHQQEIQVVLEKPNGFSSSPSTPPPPPNSRTPEVDTFVNEDVESLRKTVQDLLVQLQEAERQHQSERVDFEVYLKGRSGDKMIHEKNINQLKSEVQYIQEARNSLQKLREDISSKLDKDPGASLHQQEIQVVLEKPNGFSSSPSTPPPPPNSRTPEVDTFVNEDVESLRKTVQDLLVQLQEAERQHQSERVDFEATLSRYQREAEQSHVALQRAEDRVEQKEAEVEELQKRLLGMETEHQALLAKVREGETALEELRGKNSDCRAEQEKAANLEKEVAGLREKIHHLDDMLKSQQRKVRQMIEQLQNSKTVIQSKDTAIQELKEKIAYLEAENLEMHDRMEHLIEKQISHGNFSTQNRAKTENPGSVRISKPPSPKPMPLIRVVET